MKLQNLLHTFSYVFIADSNIPMYNIQIILDRLTLKCLEAKELIINLYCLYRLS